MLINFDLPDDQFMEQMAKRPQGEEATAATTEPEAPVVEDTGSGASEEAPTGEAPGTGEAPATAGTAAPLEPTGEATPSGDQGAGQSADTTNQPVVDPSKAEPAASTEPAPAVAVNYQTEYEKLMAPFTANGKSIQVKSVDEAVQLMRMGANYTRKMQSIAPHRKVLMMLEANNLLDEGKLSRLIDLERKNPDAIKALVKEAGIDPMDIDPGDIAYVPGNHSVPEEAVAMQTVLDEVNTTPEGQAIVQTIHQTWDQASKAALWKDPSIITLMHQQHASGVYARVAAEVDRQRMLGVIPEHVPFLHAYHEIGTRMTQAGAFQDLQPKPVVQAPVATRVATTKPATPNAAKAAAAAPTRTTPAQATPFVNVFAMDDDAFMKQFANRV